MKRGDYVSISDLKPVSGRFMPTIRGYGCGTIFKVHNDGLYVVVQLPNGVRQKIPRGRCKVLKDEKEYFKYLLKGGSYQ